MALFLAVLLGLQPVLTDLFIPAMPAIRQEFSAPSIMIQATMFGAMIAFGLGQLIWGALSDRVGRKPVLLWAYRGSELVPLSVRCLVVCSWTSGGGEPILLRLPVRV